MNVARKTFAEKELPAAYEFAAAGGQALHIISGRYAHLRKDTPACFKNRGEIAHLFDQDIERLKQTAKSLGVRVLKVERIGERGQHIDLCGGPLAKARKVFSERAPDSLSLFETEVTTAPVH